MIHLLILFSYIKTRTSVKSDYLRSPLNSMRKDLYSRRKRLCYCSSSDDVLQTFVTSTIEGSLLQISFGLCTYFRIQHKNKNVYQTIE